MTKHDVLQHQAQERRPRNRRPSRSSARSTGCLRAIAGKPELEVAFAAERPGLVGGKARLPEPPRKLTARGGRDRARPRRFDRAASSPATIRRCIAGWCPAASRRARCSRRSSRRASRRSARAACSASQSNLAAMLDDRFHRGKFDEVTDRADAPIEEAVAMMVRERLTGQAPPPAAQASSSICGGRSSRSAPAATSTGSSACSRTSARFGDAVHDLLDSLDMGEDRASTPKRRRTARRASRTAARTRPARRARPPSPRTWRR